MTQIITKKGNGLLLRWLLLSLVILIIAGGIFFYLLSTANPAPSASGASPTPTPSAAVALTNPLDGWKTYINTTYSYSIKYPPSWVVTDTSPQAVNFGSERLKPDTDQMGTFGIIKSDNTVEALIVEFKSEFTNPEEQSLKIDGLTATKISGTPGPDTFFGGTHRSYIVFQKNSNIFYIMINDNGDQTILDYADKMINTFEFTS